MKIAKLIGGGLIVLELLCLGTALAQAANAERGAAQPGSEVARCGKGGRCSEPRATDTEIGRAFMQQTQAEVCSPEVADCRALSRQRRAAVDHEARDRHACRD